MLNKHVLDASMEVGVEVNGEKTKYCVSSSRYQIAGQNRHNIADKSFETVAKFIYLGIRKKSTCTKT
jgi:hypothetical protein